MNSDLPNPLRDLTITDSLRSLTYMIPWRRFHKYLSKSSWVYTLTLSHSSNNQQQWNEVLCLQVCFLQDDYTNLSTNYLTQIWATTHLLQQYWITNTTQIWATTLCALSSSLEWFLRFEFGSYCSWNVCLLFENETIDP